MTAYRFAKKSGIPQSTIWSILKKEDYEVREKNIRKICKAMGISASEIMESEEEAKRNLRAGEIPVMHKYRKLDESDQCRVRGIRMHCWKNRIGRRVHHEITQITKKLKMVDFFWEIA